MIKLDRADTPAAPEHATIYLAFELSKAKWKLGVLVPGSQNSASGGQDHTTSPSASAPFVRTNKVVRVAVAAIASPPHVP